MGPSLGPFAGRALRPRFQNLDILQDQLRLMWKQGWRAQKLALDLQHPLILGSAMLRNVGWGHDGEDSVSAAINEPFYYPLAPGLGGRK